MAESKAWLIASTGKSKVTTWVAEVERQVVPAAIHPEEQQKKVVFIISLTK